MANRQKIYEITNGRCFYCGCELDIESFHADHFVAKANGGKESKNLVPACPDCNHCKGKLTIEEFRTKIENLLEDRFVGKLIKKYYKIEKKNIKFFFEEVQDGDL